MQIGRDDLSRPAQAAAQAFSVVAELLAEVRAALADLCGRLQNLDRVLADQGGNASLLDAVDAAAATVLAVVDDASAHATPERIGSAVALALSSLDDLGTCTREIDAVATLTRVTSRSLNMTSFDDYVLSLRGIVEEMRADSGRLSQTVLALQSRRIRAVELFDRAQADLRQVTSMLAAVAGERAEIERLLLQSLEEVAATAVRLPSATAAEIEVLMRAIQFSDALSQRLDHIARLLDLQGKPGSTGPLARAQIEALVGETREIAGAAVNSLDRIGRLADDVGRIMGSESDSPARQALLLGQDILSRIAGRTQSVLAAIEGAEGESGALCTSAAEAAERFASVMAATQAMHVHAVNAALLARRGAGQQGAMNVLSVEVQRKAAQCAGLAKKCHGAISQLSLPEDLAAFSGVGEGVRAYRSSIGQTSAAVEAAETASAELQVLRKATVAALERLSGAAGVALKAIEAIYASADDLASLARNLPRDIAGDADPLLDVMDIYSMEAERIVHRRVFGLPENTMAEMPAAAAEDDLLASIMF